MLVRAFAAVPLVCSLVLGAVHADAAPDAPEALDWRAVGRASALSWTAPGGDPVASYEVRGSTAPIDDATFDAAAPLAFFPSGTPRPPGVLEFRELDEVEVDEGEEEPTVLESALYFAVRAVDDTGAPGLVAATDGFELVQLRATTDRQSRTKLQVKGRFATVRSGLDLASGDMRIRVVQGAATLLDETIAASEFPTGGKKVRLRNPTATLRRLEVLGTNFSRLVVKTHKDVFGLVEGDVTVQIDLGTRPFAADGTLRAKGRTLVYP